MHNILVLHYNKDLKHNGRVMFGDASIDESWGVTWGK